MPLPVNPITLITQTLGISQAELAKRIGVSTGLVSMWKTRGYITQRHLTQVCNVSGLPPYVLNPNIPAPSTAKPFQDSKQ